MKLIKKLFADKSRIAILSVCLLMLSVVIVSSLTGETLAADASGGDVDIQARKMCYVCSFDKNILKWSDNGGNDYKCPYDSPYFLDATINEANCKTYTITYNDETGFGAFTELHYRIGTKAKIAGLKKEIEGFELVGFSTNPYTSKPIYKTGDVVTMYSNLNLYAIWKETNPAKTITVTFNPNGGNINGSTASKDISFRYVNNDSKYNDTYSFPTPTRNAYRFKGWYSSASGGIKIGENEQFYSTNNHSLFAQWEPIGATNPVTTVTVIFNPNGGNIDGSMESKELSFQYIDSNSKYNETRTFPTPTRNGYTFLGWYTSNSGGSKVVANQNIVSLSEHTLYAHWNQNNGNDDDDDDENTPTTHKVKIKYKTNLGTVRVANGISSKDGVIYEDGSPCIQTINYGGKTNDNGLNDYNNYNFIFVTRAGYSAPVTSEWICLSGCTTPNKTFNQKTIYSHNDFCDASTSDCEVVLGVNWVQNKVKINYRTQGGIVKSKTSAGSWSVSNDLVYKNNILYETTINYGSKLDSNGLTDYKSNANLYITKTGKDANEGAEWICLEGCRIANKTFNQVTSYNASDFCDATNGDCTVVLGVNWRTNKVNINYNPYGGVVNTKTDDGAWKVVDNLIYKNDSLLTTTVNYANKLDENGLIDYYSGVNLQITKTGYSAPGGIGTDGKKWICLKGCTTANKTFDQKTQYNANDFCDASEEDCTVVLGVNWQPNKYTVKYNSNGGTGTMKNSEYTYDVTKTLSTNKFTRTGYRFIGWNTKLDGSGTSYKNEQSVQNLTSTNGATITLYAMWTANKYAVKYNSNGGIGTMVNSTYTYGVAKSLTINSFIRDNYTFKCWNTKADGSGTNYKDGQSVKNLTSVNGATVTLYAKWTANKYTVKYNANGGTGTMSDSTYTYGVTKALSSNSFTRTDSTFKCWNTKADGTGINYKDKQNVNIAEDLTLYAQWKSNDSTGDGSGEEETVIMYYIHYDKNGGTGTMKNSEHIYDYASNLSKNTFKRTGYTFNGWNTKADGTGTTYTDGQTISNLSTNNGDIVTLYAQWLEIVKEEVPTNPGSGSDNSGNQGNNNNNGDDNIDKSPQTGMLATIIVSLIGIGAFGGVIYYRKKIKN